MMNVDIKVENDSIFVRTPYDPLFIGTLKKAFTDSERTYDEATRQWIIAYNTENYQLLQKLVREHFGDTEPRLVIFKCESRAPRVNGMMLIDYSRDYDKKTNAWCYDVITYRRFASCGSRRHPRFEGIVLAKVLMNKNTKFSSKGEMEYKVYPYTKSLHMTAVELIEKAESLDDYEKIVEKLDEIAQKLEGFSVEISEKEAVVVKGFLVLSSLPSKALLDKALPEEFKNTRIGTKFVKVVSGYFYNKLGTLSRKFYNSILEKYAVWAGFGYIVPAHKVTGFIGDIEELRREYEEFERQLREFLEEGKIPEDISDRAKIEPEYVELVREYLKEHGVEEINVPKISERVKIRLVPFSVDIGMVEEYLEERAVESVRKELEDVKREMVDSVREQLEKQLNSIFERLKRYESVKMSKRAMKKLKEDIESLVKTAEDIGVEIERANALKKTIEAIEELESDSEKVKITSEERSGRVRALLKELGIETE